MEFSIANTVIGFFVGTLVGLTGVGGGTLMTPIMILMMGVPPTLAVGTDLLYAGATKSVGALIHGWQKTVCWRTVGLLVSGSIPGALLSGALFHQLQQTFGAEIEIVIGRGVGILLMVTALAVVLSTKAQKNTSAVGLDADSGATPACKGQWTLPIIGFVVGTLVTFTSVGSGVLVAAALYTLLPGLGVARIVGTDVAHAAILIVVGASEHAGMGNVDYGLAFSLMAGSIPGVAIGSRFVTLVPEKVVKVTVSSVMMIAGIKLV
jgi:hypothetical protein